MAPNKNLIRKGFIWTALERFSSQLVLFVIGIIIARLVTPSEYGILGILMVFINISQVFIDSGLGSALIYENKIEKDSLQTIFSFNLFVSILLYLLLFFAAPLVESFYNLPKLSLYLRISALVLFTNSFIVVPTAVLKIRLDLRSLAIANFTSSILSGLLGVYMAWKGLGVWALIGQMLSKSAFLLLLITIPSKVFPILYFRIETFKRLFKYGVNIFGATCITKIVDEGIYFVIGKVLNPFGLGIYTRGNQFASLPGNSMNSIMSSVLFPSLSGVKENRKDFNSLYIKGLEVQSLVCFPLFFFLAMAAFPLVRLLLTEKWIAVVPILQVLCIGRAFAPIAYVAEQAINAAGRSDLFLKQQIVKLIVKFVFVAFAIPFGLIAIAIADAVATAFQVFITNYFARPINIESLRGQLMIAFPYAASAIISAIAGLLVSKLISSDLLSILVAIPFAFVFYVSCLIILFGKKEKLAYLIKRKI